MATEDTLRALDDLLIDALMRKLRGEGDQAPTAADLNVARQLLRDRGMECDPDQPPASHTDLAEAIAAAEDLPHFN